MTKEILNIERKPSLPLWARIILVIIAYLVITVLFQLIGILAMGYKLTELDQANLAGIEMLIIQFFGLLATIFVIYIFRVQIDRKSILSLGFSFKNRGKDLLMGFIVALLLIGLGSIFLVAFGFVEFSYFMINIQSLVTSFLIFIIVALNEEVLIRGYVLNNLMTKLNKFLALVISAMIFALFHAFNQNASAIPLINIFLAGILLGAAYVYTKNLWFPISIHLFWNFFQGPILGYEVSGNETESIFKVKTIGSAFINGGKFGFEGSFVCSILIVISVALIFYYYIKKSQKKEAINTDIS